MAELINTAVVCLTEEEFENTTRFRHVEGQHEFHHVSTLDALNRIDMLTNIIYLSSAKELSEFDSIHEAVNEKGVSQKWQ